LARLSPAVRKLLEGPVDSFEKLELVLALFRSTTPLGPADLRDTLQLSLDTVQRLLDELADSALITLEPSGDSTIARLVPKENDGAALNELARLYDDDRVLVVTTLSNIAMDRIRGMAARTFADAFQLRKKRGKDDEDG
jgi:hypothetical protein